MSSEGANITEGWTWLLNAVKWHYFIDGRSLCEKYLVLGPQDYEKGNDDSPSNCATCKRKLAARRKKEATV